MSADGCDRVAGRCSLRRRGAGRSLPVRRGLDSSRLVQVVTLASRSSEARALRNRSSAVVRMSPRERERPIQHIRDARVGPSPDVAFVIRSTTAAKGNGTIHRAIVDLGVGNHHPVGRRPAVTQPAQHVSLADRQSVIARSWSTWPRSENPSPGGVPIRAAECV